jgi:hemin uptake protein HemP
VSTHRANAASDAKRHDDERQVPSTGQGPSSAGRRQIRSSELFSGGSSELAIEHNGDVYCLRCTSKGKLILTK